MIKNFISKFFDTINHIINDKRYFEVFILGIISGMPLVLIYSTFSAWLKDNQIPIEIITTFAIARLPYSLKFLWAPVIDHIKIPFLTKFGHRKSWLILCSLITSFILYALSFIDLHHNTKSLYILSIILGTISATYDINVDAFRIENFPTKLQSQASAISVMGYRVGMLITGAGALQISYLTNWSLTFIVLSIVFFIATIYIFFVKENYLAKNTINFFSLSDFSKELIAPFKELLTRDYSWIILAIVILFKMGDAMIAVVSMPFYLEMGFNKQQIAVIAKVWGLMAMLFGSYTAGVFLDKLGIVKGLVIICVTQALTHLAFAWLYYQGNTDVALFVSITIENLGAGIGSTALIIYLSTLCSKKYSATQYAFLSSASSLCSNTITIGAGYLVKLMGWINYFLFTIVLALPAFFLLLYMYKNLPSDICNPKDHDYNTNSV